ncbi:hypothetical protein B0T24DRAFT_598110 [Lasiosphaeria ovina]|uniref:Uncharacterized protein n=1 Tax=Lasiosphaeria ovina TaxID=92902 RepID=A0AAE0JV09_9PEZI|nr:hypothetical protein B0T24DRAFT_598110 [Lasiosphaeria ovina]
MSMSGGVLGHVSGLLPSSGGLQVGQGGEAAALQSPRARRPAAKRPRLDNNGQDTTTTPLEVEDEAVMNAPAAARISNADSLLVYLETCGDSPQRGGRDTRQVGAEDLASPLLAGPAQSRALRSPSCNPPSPSLKLSRRGRVLLLQLLLLLLKLPGRYRKNRHWNPSRPVGNAGARAPTAGVRANKGRGFGARIARPPSELSEERG